MKLFYFSKMFIKCCSMIYSDISGGESLEIHARNLLKIETIFGAGGGGDAPPYPCLQTCIIILFKLGFFIYHKINSHSWTSIRSISVAPPPPNTHLFLFMWHSFRSCTFNFSCTQHPPLFVLRPLF